jgi:L-cystine transport system substrate-binding protein
MVFLSLWSLFYSAPEAIAADNGSVTLYAGTQSDFPPFCYINDDNVLTGYDVEVMKEIDKRLDGYTIEFKPMAWDAIFLSLESRAIDLIGDVIGVREERKIKFLFSEPYYSAQNVMVVRKGRKDIVTSQDLRGKVVCAYVGEDYTRALEEFNETHDNKINLSYVDGVPYEDILVAVQNGKYDAFVNNPLMMTELIKKHNLNVEIVGEPVTSGLVALVFNNDQRGHELKALIDPIITAMKNDGALSKLCVEWTGGDYVPK